METDKLKSLLNNTLLLKWVKKYSADNLLDDNKMANEKFKISTNDDSVSILDSSATKLFVTNSKFNGEEYVRFNLKQLNELLDIAGKEGELIIPKDTENNEMIAKVGDDIAVVCPLPKQDK